MTPPAVVSVLWFISSAKPHKYTAVKVVSANVLVEYNTAPSHRSSTSRHVSVCVHMGLLVSTLRYITRLLAVAYVLTNYIAPKINISTPRHVSVNAHRNHLAQPYRFTTSKNVSVNVPTRHSARTIRYSITIHAVASALIFLIVLSPSNLTHKHVGVNALTRHSARTTRFMINTHAVASALIRLFAPRHRDSIHRHASVNAPTDQTNVHTRKSSTPAVVHVNVQNRNVVHHGYTTITLANVDALLLQSNVPTLDKSGMTLHADVSAQKLSSVKTHKSIIVYLVSANVHTGYNIVQSHRSLTSHYASVCAHMGLLVSTLRYITRLLAVAYVLTNYIAPKINISTPRHVSVNAHRNHLAQPYRFTTSKNVSVNVPTRHSARTIRYSITIHAVASALIFLIVLSPSNLTHKHVGVNALTRHSARTTRFMINTHAVASALIRLFAPRHRDSIHRHASVNAPTDQTNVHTRKSSTPAVVHVNVQNRNVVHHGYTTITLANVDVLMS